MYLMPSSRKKRTIISPPDKSSTLFTSKTPEYRPLNRTGLNRFYCQAEHERRWSPTTSALTEQVLGSPLSVSGLSHPARGKALRVLQVGAGVRLMIYRDGLLLAVLPQRTLDCCD